MANEYKVHLKSISGIDAYIETFADYESQAKENVKMKLRKLFIHDFWEVKEVELINVSF